MTIADSDGDILHFYHLVPIGSVVAWLKDFTNTPALPEGWVECDGSAISDAASPYNGQNAPDLNSSIGDSNKGRFLRGHSASGQTEISQNLAHGHTINAGAEAGTGLLGKGHNSGQKQLVQIHQVAQKHALLIIQ